MSKYTEAAKLIIEEHRQDRCWTEESFEAAQKIKEACRIADRLEDTDVREVRFDYCNSADCDIQKAINRHDGDLIDVMRYIRRTRDD